MTVSIAVIGECMLELSHAKNVGDRGDIALPMNMSYGGDTINTSIYLSRNDMAVSYITGLGDDVNSDWLIEQWKSEGIDCSLVTRMPNSVPGMYMINVDADGERSFLYWRKGSPASRLFDDSYQVDKLFKGLISFDYLYLSGISLAILAKQPRERLCGLLEKYRQQGGKIVFDGNYRPNLWSNIDDAKEVYIRMYQMTDVAMPTLEDENLLFGLDTAEQVLRCISAYGVPEVVVKMGGDGCLVLDDGVLKHVEAESVQAVDTTAAGDSFNAGYLSARLKGHSKLDASQAGHQLASKVIQHRGAIIPRLE